MLHRGQQLVAAAEIDCRDVEECLGHLQVSWDTLRETAARRLQRLRDASEAQQYYLDAGEAEAWISEQEFYVFSDETPQVGSGRVPGWVSRPAQRKSWVEVGSQWGTCKARCVRSEGRERVYEVPCFSGRPSSQEHTAHVLQPGALFAN